MLAPAAVLFDLWGTLVPPIPPVVRDEVSRAMAADMGIDPEEFAAAYRNSYAERFLGATGTLEETVAALAKACGVAPSTAAVARAATRRLDLTRRLLLSDARTIDVLDILRGRGFLLGLVSDSSVETPAQWSASPLASRLDAVVFSCLLGVRKPDPRLYRHALDTLGCAAGDCVYVGDGGSHELSGAAALGMHAIRLRPPGDSPSDRYEDDSAFAGPWVASLSDLLRFPWARPR
jgi:putative hydrolase of the HAD superfamily